MEDAETTRTIMQIILMVSIFFPLYLFFKTRDENRDKMNDLESKIDKRLWEMEKKKWEK